MEGKDTERKFNTSQVKVIFQTIFLHTSRTISRFSRCPYIYQAHPSTSVFDTPCFSFIHAHTAIQYVREGTFVSLSLSLSCPIHQRIFSPHAFLAIFTLFFPRHRASTSTLRFVHTFQSLCNFNFGVLHSLCRIIFLAIFCLSTIFHSFFNIVSLSLFAYFGCAVHI